jgi:hypothetical protein
MTSPNSNPAAGDRGALVLSSTSSTGKSANTPVNRQIQEIDRDDLDTAVIASSSARASQALHVPTRVDAVIDTLHTARLRCLASRLHELGERPLYELLRELLSGQELLETLERYARLDPDVIRALGADRLPPSCRQVQP